jgi:hypothetical protein
VFRTILAPGFLVDRDLQGLLTESVVGHAGRADLDHAVVGALHIGYVRERLNLADIGEPGPASEPLTDEHGRQIEIVYGVVCREALAEPIDGDDLRAARDEALQSYRRFLADENAFRVERAAGFALRTAVRSRPSESPAATEPDGQVAPAAQCPNAAPRQPRRRHEILGAIVAIAAVGAAATLATVGDDKSVAPLIARAVHPPRIVRATDGRRHIAYELTLTNDTRARVRVARIDVLDVAGERQLATYGAVAVARLAGVASGSALTVARASRRTLAIDLRMCTEDRPPAQIQHRFAVTTASQHGGWRRVAFTAPATRVDRREPVRLGLPMSATNLLVTTTVPFEPLATPRDARAIRGFAIDFRRLRDDGAATSDGDPSLNASYFVFGDRVLAAAAGTVVAVRDDVADNVPPRGAARSARGDERGNFVVEDVGDGFAVYAGLRHASVRVRPGQRVRRGQLLGAVGNSGKSDQPRLRFRLTGDRKDAGGSEGGLPFVFDRFSLMARLTREPAGDARRRPAPARAHVHELPLSGDVVGAPQARAASPAARRAPPASPRGSRRTARRTPRAGG